MDDKRTTSLKKFKRIGIGCAVLLFLLLVDAIYMYGINEKRATIEKNTPAPVTPDTTQTIQSLPIELSLIIASTSAEQELGLGQRTSLPLDEGMLFVFATSSNYGFWMKDMHFSIDMIWMDENFSITHIASDVSPDTYPEVFNPGQKSLYVLETNAGYAEKNGLTVGETLDFVEKSLENSQ
jgi:uncharacterized membrane protein (UPF0127 family)